ncbi:MarR family transcriptional regulator [Paenibacillus filicis]|uniref:MarR family transcriptional regulator n=1 Tax=Paenibacillus filicis TaxID=669464 RepID=UPI0031197F0F
MNKQMLYDHYIRYLHIQERLSESEIKLFFSLIEEAKMEDSPQSITAVHVVECIGKYHPINSTSIAEKMGLSKASITKIGNKLLLDGYVKRTQLTENKKEVYFRLTPKGKKIFELHEKLHELEEQRFYRFLDKYSDEEITVIRRFLQDYSLDMESRLSRGITLEDRGYTDEDLGNSLEEEKS